MTPPNRRDLSFDERYREARFVVSYPNYVDVEVQLPHGQMHRVRIKKEHWPDYPPQWSDLKPGSDLGTVFIHHFEADVYSHSFGSLRWGKPEHNPWEPQHPDHPQLGEQLVGEVIAPAGDQFVVLRLERSHQEAFLHRGQCPGGASSGKTALDVVPLGTRVLIRLQRVDAHRCNMQASVIDSLAQLAKEDSALCVGDVPIPPRPGGELIRRKDTPFLVSIAAGTGSPIAPTGAAMTDALGLTNSGSPAVLVIDDHKDFLRDLTDGLRLLGVSHVWGAKDANEARERFASAEVQPGHHITHVMVDFHLGSRAERDAVLKVLLRHSGRLKRVVLMSGMTDSEVMEFAGKLRGAVLAKDTHGDRQTSSLEVLRKPIAASTLQAWLTGADLPSEASEEPKAEERTWGSGYVSSGLNNSRIERWLQRACAHFNAQAGLWVQSLHPGYAVVGHIGIRNDYLSTTVASLGQSGVADVEATGGSLSVELTDAGVLRQLWPAGARHALILPMGTTEEKDSVSTPPASVLIFFSPSAATADLWSKDNAAWTLLYDWWQDLVTQQDYSCQLLEQEAFATLGRAWAVSAHESRHLLQPFANKQAWSAELSKTWWPNGTRLLRLAEGGLYRIRTLRSQRIHVGVQVQRIFDEVLWTFAQRAGVAVWWYQPAMQLVAQLPPEVLEHPLINLVENAIKACRRMRSHRPHARVEVGVTIDTEDRAHPLVIWVEDKGDGLTLDQQRRLFLPRQSVDVDGTGLGLFLSRRMVQAAGGELRLAHSVRWGGSRFELRLPLVWAGNSP